MRYFGLLLLAFATANAQTEQNPDRLFRFADIYKDKVAFVFAGDIYTASVDGGVATRITSHQGKELFPKFSPDGKQIAFSAEYSGTRQVYVMPTAGGDPKQLTFYNDVGPMPPRGGYDYRVMDWTPDGNHVLVRANRLPWGPRMGRPYLVPVNGGLAKPLAVPEGGGGMFSPDGSKLVYTPIDREFRTWKRYRGGRAQDVWTYDLESDQAAKLTDNRATDNQPVWVGSDIFFTSDRAYTLNLYRHNDNGEPEQVTFHEDFDVLWPSAGPNAVVYEAGGFLYRYDPSSESSSKLDITVQGDWPDARPHFKNVNQQIESADLSPKGNRVVFGARGELYSLPAENGRILNLSKSPDEREIFATWSPNGKWIAYLSDATGEYELYITSHDGTQTQQLTDNGDIWRFAPVWSPNSEKLAFSDKRQTLWVVDVASKKQTRIDRSSHNDIQEYSWSPDSNWLAYTKANDTGINDIWVSKLGGKPMALTDATTNDGNPVFDPKGRFLYFLSNRDFNLQFSAYEFNFLYTDATRVYAGLINDSVKPLFQPKEDAVELDAETTENADTEAADDAFDFQPEGFANRVQALVKSGSNYQGLAANDAGVFFLEGNNNTTLKHFSVADEKVETVAEEIGQYALSATGNKLLVRSGSDWSVVDAAPKQKPADKKVKLNNLVQKIDPAVEWQQMYVDAWRILRDWFYDPNMHGQDWDAIREKYQPMVASVRHRSDLDYILSEIAGEMNAGHIYVQSGDEPSVKRLNGGLLGAELERHRSGFYQISKIFPGENWHNQFRSPLTEPGVGAAEGDFIVSIDGIPTNSVENIYELLENKGGKLISVGINGRGRLDGAEEVLVKTIASETNLRYLDWVAERRRLVDEWSDGRIGYIHVPNTAVEGSREMFKHFPPQSNKAALIIDDRYNGGGFIPDRLIELLSRKTLNYWKRRGLDPTSTPGFAHDGPKAMLINGYSSSGGDALPYYFRKLNLGPLIGTRTWGGLIGISGNPGLADGGLVLASTFRFMDTNGDWAVENVGVSPDIEVVDRPDAVAKGEDPSLRRAVQYLLEELEKNPQTKVSAPPAPTEF